MRHLELPDLNMSMKEYLNLSKQTRITRTAISKYLSGESNIGQKPSKRAKKEEKISTQPLNLAELQISSFLGSKSAVKVQSMKINTFPKHCLPNYLKTIEIQRDINQIQTTQLMSNSRKGQGWIIKCLGDRTKLVNQSQKLIGLQQPAYYQLNFKAFCEIFQRQTSQLKQQEKLLVFNQFKLNQDECIYWPVGIFQPLNFQSIDIIKQDISTKRCRDDRVKISFEVKDHSLEVLQSQSEYAQQSQMQEVPPVLEDIVLPMIVQNLQQEFVNIGTENIVHEQNIAVSQNQQSAPKNDDKITQPLESERPAQSNASQRAHQQQIYQKQEGKKLQIPKKTKDTNYKQMQSLELIQRFATQVNKASDQKGFWQSQVLVWFTGTNVYKLVSVKDLIHFNQIVPQQAIRFFKETRLMLIKQDVFQFVHLVNTSIKKYDYSDLKQDEKRNFIHRLARYKDQQELIYYLILRHKQSKQSRQVLVLNLKHAVITWENPEKFTVCYLLPKIPDKQLKALLILPLVPFQSRQQYILEILFKEFHYNHNSQQQLFNKFFRQNYHIQNSQDCRCQNCNYRISPILQRSIQCYFCHSKYHSDCDDQKRVFSFQESPDKVHWCCYNCVPCVVCFMNISKKNLVECITCKNHFHQQCGINKNSSGKYECQDCLKCDLCLKKLTNCSEECFVQDNYIYCQNCVKLIGKGDYCKICKGTQCQDSKSNWIKCDTCNGWIHRLCDETLKGNYKYFIQQKIQYFCPFCRDDLRRLYTIQLINILMKFDDFGYFTPPVPETLLDYKDIISEPMCFHEMIKRCETGLYDVNCLQNVKRDVKLIVSNAMEYNMPKDHCHYSARVLNIMSIQFFDFFKEFFQIHDIKLISDKGISQSILQTQRKLFKFIYEHYLQIILNFGDMKSQINIKMKPIQPTQPAIFRSRQLLNLFKNCQISITFKKDNPLIDHLFSLPKVYEPSKLPITHPICYYHNQPNTISSCSICLQSYCCISECILHHRCSQCGQMGCRCDSWGCKCAPGIHQKDLDHANLREYKHDLLTITQMFRYCPRCSIENIQSRKCKYCNKICTYNYVTCIECQKRFHKGCNSKSIIPGLCFQCQNLPSAKLKKKEALQIQIIKISTRMMKIQKLLEKVMNIYANQGIHLTPIQTRKLLEDNYEFIEEYFYDIQNYEVSDQEISALRTEEQKMETQNKAIYNVLNGGMTQLSDDQLWQIKLLKFNLKYHIQPLEIQKQSLPYAYFFNTKAEILSCMVDECFVKYSTYFYFNPSEIHEQLPVLEFLPTILSYSELKFLRQIRKLKHSMQLSRPNCLLSEQKRLISLNWEDHSKRKQYQSNKKLSTIRSILRGVLIDIYNTMKLYSRMGSTCLINLKNNNIEIYKKWNKQPGIWINLWKMGSLWKIKINQKTTLLNNFEELVNVIRKISGGQKSTIYNLEDVARFLGFNIYEDAGTPYTYTTFLQTHPMESGDRRPGVLKAFNSLQISNVDKKQLFFMKKKSKEKQVDQKILSNPPYFLFQELRRQLQDQPFIQKQELKKSQPSRQIFIAPSTIHKLGLFSTKFQKKNTVLIQYMGQILSEPMADLRQSLYHLGCYMFAIPKKLDENIKTNQDPTYDSTTPHMNNSKRDVIDATFRGNQARYLNHSCDPNCASMIQQINGSPRILIYAIRDLQPFEELTYDYQFKVTAGEKIICTCKSKNCQGRLN